MRISTVHIEQGLTKTASHHATRPAINHRSLACQAGMDASFIHCQTGHLQQYQRLERLLRLQYACSVVIGSSVRQGSRPLGVVKRPWVWCFKCDGASQRVMRRRLLPRYPDHGRYLATRLDQAADSSSLVSNSSISATHSSWGWDLVPRSNSTRASVSAVEYVRSRTLHHARWQEPSCCPKG